MGIQNWWKMIGDITDKEKNLHDFNGFSIGVDISCWMHQGIVTDPWKLLNGNRSTKFENFLRNRLLRLLRAGMKLRVVFDGKEFDLVLDIFSL